MAQQFSAQINNILLVGAEYDSTELKYSGLLHVQAKNCNKKILTFSLNSRTRHAIEAHPWNQFGRIEDGLHRRQGAELFSRCIQCFDNCIVHLISN
mmetsp:Transcript_48142/g.100648  ORF Transcript_48142/g.100648 Transcript_48142/m.100648 type:complete len:96 (-) Transcript_48142:332-619(-)